MKKEVLISLALMAIALLFIGCQSASSTVPTTPTTPTTPPLPACSSLDSSNCGTVANCTACDTKCYDTSTQKCCGTTIISISECCTDGVKGCSGELEECEDGTCEAILCGQRDTTDKCINNPDCLWCDNECFDTATWGCCYIHLSDGSDKYAPFHKPSQKCYANHIYFLHDYCFFADVLGCPEGSGCSTYPKNVTTNARCMVNCADGRVPCGGGTCCVGYKYCDDGACALCCYGGGGLCPNGISESHCKTLDSVAGTKCLWRC